MCADVGGDAQGPARFPPRCLRPRARRRRRMLEVRYRYEDDAVVPVDMSRKTSLSLALLGQEHEADLEVVKLCTTNDHEARADAEIGMLWYDYDPGRATCRHAIEAEQERI